MKQMARQYGMGFSAWMGKFAFGFFITGLLARKRLYHRGEISYTRIAASKLYATAPARFRGRAQIWP